MSTPTPTSTIIPSSLHSPKTPYLLPLLIFITTLAAIGAGVYVSGAGDDAAWWIAERFLKVKAKAEEKALENVGEEKGRGFLKEQLKKNPLVSNDEIDEIEGKLEE